MAADAGKMNSVCGRPLFSQEDYMWVLLLLLLRQLVHASCEGPQGTDDGTVDTR